ncbi:hypothetical protein PLICRDRAFT_45592 [Plicaturopsis crispa FD-325 SS-3]|uniref:FAD-binding domain-containing protein n=1 Tax=Plicaturopsis crispa FD-325 SS-3 TaxID=944288 RepID=A0A0C9T643_PLICR|nr:hypothetical protein PLICRDRAFT_45592 [Plicaturopsis crispa FD-325 SS-3]
MSTSSTSTYPRIAIIGGGPGGLTLARILQVNGVRATIYERETLENPRIQGGSLDLHVESGIAALRAAGLFEDFKKLIRQGSQQTRIFDTDGKMHLNLDGPRGPPDDDNLGRPEIDRPVLRNLLLNSLDKDTVKWGHDLQTVLPNEGSGGFRLAFKDGREETADLVIGADGAWSKIRPLLTPAKPVYSGTTMIELRISDIDARYPELSALAGQGTVFILSSDGKAIFPQRNGDGSVRVYASLHAEEQWLDSQHAILGKEGPAAALEAIAALFPGWSSTVLDLIRNSDQDKITPRRIFQLPLPFNPWTTKPGLTVLGDAAHLMSPFAGEGVNLAMIDATDLAKAIVGVTAQPGASADALTDALRGYEEVMLKRSEEMAIESARNMDLIFGQDALKNFLGFFARFGLVPEGEEKPEP